MREILQHIEEQVGRQTLLPSTLKRPWGYFPSVRKSHPYTLDLLQRFAAMQDSLIITRGQEFASVGDYHSLFGICEKASTPPHFWSQPLPEHLGIIVWSPEYRHPEWHNQGDASLLMPTITEWYVSPDSGGAHTERNADNYLRDVDVQHGDYRMELEYLDADGMILSYATFSGNEYEEYQASKEVE